MGIAWRAPVAEMLRLTEGLEGESKKPQRAVIALAGALSPEEFDILEERIEEHRQAGRSLALDLKDLREADLEGCEFIRALERSGVELRRIPQFLSARLCEARRSIPSAREAQAPTKKQGENRDA